MLESDPRKFCDPIGTYESPQSLEVSILLLIILWATFNILALIIMKLQSRKYE